MADGEWLYTTVHYSVSPSDSATTLRPANEEQIIVHQWEQYEARGSPDTYEMVTCVVAYADEQLGQEVNPEAEEASCRAGAATTGGLVVVDV